MTNLNRETRHTKVTGTGVGGKEGICHVILEGTPKSGELKERWGCDPGEVQTAWDCDEHWE